MGQALVVIHGRPRDLGGFSVRRVLPARERRHLGPFVFFDHMGPAAFAPGAGVDVRPHPHISLSTVTYLFDGVMLHRDSTGVTQPIRPGAVNWMTAGRGVVHSERSPEEERARGARLHGIQAWVALPDGREDDPPSFHHHAAESIPEVARPGARLRVIAGAAYGATSPVAALSSLFYVEARLDAGAELALPVEYTERGVYVVDGAVDVLGADDASFEQGALVIAGAGDVRLRARAAAHLMLLGGEPLGERHIWWNFVASSEERIERAKRDWREENEARFPRVPGDEHERIPLPEF